MNQQEGKVKAFLDLGELRKREKSFLRLLMRVYLSIEELQTKQGQECQVLVYISDHKYKRRESGVGKADSSKYK